MKNNPQLTSFVFKVVPFVALIFIAFVCTITANNICRFVEIKLEGENDLITMEQGIWQGHLDKFHINDECERYMNSPFDRNWHFARVFSVISQLLSCCLIILTIELIKFKYDHERRVALTVTCMELVFTQGFTLLFVDSIACLRVGMRIPEQFNEADSSCHWSAGFYLTIFTIPMWGLAAALAMNLPLPGNELEFE